MIDPALRSTKTRSLYVFSYAANGPLSSARDHIVACDRKSMRMMPSCLQNLLNGNEMCALKGWSRRRAKQDGEEIWVP
eukprot:COSAG03_NODE_10204_length_665_cov_1.141343_1_plen_78_part_00